MKERDEYPAYTAEGMWCALYSVSDLCALVMRMYLIQLSTDDCD